ncbi:IgA-specific serine endopeptidase autotransporter precursor [Alienimonas californiensis]|uniref:IgA-specific serine endopeptidase autotransporter n=2 Tax=Alienimonas californiensis TaxID=2527989 RepID=A0A517P5Z5_9PLAN|nr:IgA-specific serine endopeptidase autotransporter precursor [Alienimonas californiensis]
MCLAALGAAAEGVAIGGVAAEGVAIGGVAAERAEAGRAEAGRPVAASRGRRAAEALPPGRFRTALLAELAALDARRPALALTGAGGEIIVTPPEPEADVEPEWEVELTAIEPALASTPTPAVAPAADTQTEPQVEPAPEPLFDSSVALAAASAAVLDAAASARPAAPGAPDSAPPSWIDPFEEPTELPAAETAAEQQAAETAAAEQQAAEQKAAEQRAAEQQAEADHLERERIDAERREAARLTAERAEAEQMAADRAEADRLVARQLAEAAKAAAAAKAAKVYTPGFGPFCPVTLRDEMRLAPGRTEHAATHEAAPWHFATPEARAAFLKNPARYQPIAGGGDVVLGVLEGFRVPGRPDRCVVYRDRLYLFTSEKTRAAFVKDPRRYAAAVGQ